MDFQVFRMTWLGEFHVVFRNRLKLDGRKIAFMPDGALGIINFGIVFHIVGT